MEKIEWSRNKILSFINDYKNYRLLWDPAVKDYHVKSVKYATLELLSEKYGIEIRSIRCKIKSLRSSFHREHGKVKCSEERGVEYRPMWFAYEPMKFILDAADAIETKHYDCNDLYGDGGIGSYGGGQCDTKRDVDCQMVEDTENAAIAGEYIKTEILEDAAGNNNFLNINNNNTSFQSSILPPLKKRKRSHRMNPTHIQRELDIKTVSRTSPVSHQHFSQSDQRSDLGQPQISRDEYAIFGEYVGMTVRKLKTEKSKIVVKHFINNLLFEAEMGKYDNGISVTKSPPDLYSTREEGFQE